MKQKGIRNPPIRFLHNILFFLLTFQFQKKGMDESFTIFTLKERSFFFEKTSLRVDKAELLQLNYTQFICQYLSKISLCLNSFCIYWQNITSFKIQQDQKSKNYYPPCLFFYQTRIPL